LIDEEFPVICSPFEGRFHSIDVIARRGQWPFSVILQMMNDKFTN